MGTLLLEQRRTVEWCVDAVDGFFVCAVQDWDLDFVLVSEVGWFVAFPPNRCLDGAPSVRADTKSG